MKGRHRARGVSSRLRSAVNRVYLAEALEPRRLFDIVVNGTDGNDTLTVDCNGSFVFVTLNGIPGIPIPIIGDAGELQINGLGGNDAINVTETGGLPCLITGGSGNDTITVGGGNFANFIHGGGTSVDGDAGTDTVIIDDTADTGADTYTVSGSLDGSLTEFDKSDAAGAMDVDNTTENVQLRCNNDSNTINVNNNTDPPFASFAVQGGGGNDTLNLQEVGGSRAFSFDGGSGIDALNVQDPGFGGNTFTLTSNQLDYAFFGTADHVSWANAQQVNIDDSPDSQNGTYSVNGVGSGIATSISGGHGNDTFVVGNGDIAANILGPLSIDSSNAQGTDKVIYNDISATANSNYTVQSGTDSLSMTGLTNPITAMVDSYVLTASSGDNLITAIPAGSSNTDWIINGDLGNDHITFGNGNVAGLQGNVTLTGGGGTDTLTINDTGTPASGVTSKDYTISQGVIHTFVNASADEDIHYSSFDTVTLNAGSLPNHFTVNTALGGESSLVLNAGTGNDNLSFTPFATTGVVTFNGQGGTDTVNVDDSGDTNLIARTYTLTSSSFSKVSVDSLNFSSIEALALQGDNATDTYNINSIAAGSTTTVSGGTSPDQFNVGNGNLNTNIGGALALQGNQGGDHLVIDDHAATAASDVITLNNGTVSKATSPATSITYGTIEHVEFDGGAGNNLFDLVAPGFATDVTLKGGVGADTFIIALSQASVEVDGSDPTVAPGDVLRFANAATAGPASLAVNGSVNGTYTFASAQPVTFFGIETFPTVPTAPPAPDLFTGDDTGISNTDNITSKLTVAINGAAPVGATVQLRLGTTILGTATANTLGAYSIPVTFSADGTFAVIADVQDAASGLISGPSPVLHITIDRSAPAAPTVAPDLTDLSDTGVSNTDNLTRDNTPIFTGAVPAGTFARLLVDGSSAAFTTSTSGGAYSLTAPGLADGVRRVAVRFEDVAGNLSLAGPALAVTIDTTAPTVTGDSFAFLTTHALSFSFSENVGPTLDQTDLSLQNVTNGTTILPGSIASAYVPNTATFTFPGLLRGILPDGNYHAVLSAAGITDVAGNALASDGVLDFFILTGDVNHDRTVNFPDLLALAQHFGQAGTFAAGDVNYDGQVNFNDLLIVAQNFGHTLPASLAGTSPNTFAVSATPLGLLDDSTTDEFPLRPIAARRRLRT